MKFAFNYLRVLPLVCIGHCFSQIHSSYQTRIGNDWGEQLFQRKGKQQLQVACFTLFAIFCFCQIAGLNIVPNRPSAKNLWWSAWGSLCLDLWMCFCRLPPCVPDSLFPLVGDLQRGLLLCLPNSGLPLLSHPRLHVIYVLSLTTHFFWGAGRVIFLCSEHFFLNSFLTLNCKAVNRLYSVRPLAVYLNAFSFCFWLAKHQHT